MLPPIVHSQLRATLMEPFYSNLMSKKYDN